jgi:hypothetical protein
MGSNCSITCQDVNSNNGFHPNQGFDAGWQTHSRLTIANKVVWGRTSTKVNLLLRILLRISLAEPKAKSKKVSPTDPVEEIEAEPRSEKEEENLGKASPKDISDTHLLLYNAAILDDLLDKIDDPGVPTISCLISTQKFDQALLDHRAREHHAKGNLRSAES